MHLIDTHSHIHLPEFDQDRAEVLQRAKDTNVEHLVIVGNDHVSNQQMIALLPQFSEHSITLGIHPHHVHEWNQDTAAWLQDHLSLPQIVAVGETGLDYFRNPHPPLIQEKVMRAQIELALQHNFPVVFHMRDAFADAKRIISEYPKLRFVMHCFTGTIEDVSWIVALGGFISFSGIVTFANAQALQATVSHVPIDHILAETDSPFLAPVPHRGKRCEPAFVIETVKKLAALRNEPLEDLAQQIYHNATAIFGLANSAKL